METKHLFSTNPSFLLQRLIEQYEKQDKLIVAYDFDDTVKPYWCAGCTEVQSLLRKIRNTIDAYFIVYTCNKDHDKIRAFLDKWDIPYDSINENAPFAPDIDGKLFYNVFLDDKAGLGEVVNTLEQFLYLVRNNYITKEKKFYKPNDKFMIPCSATLELKGDRTFLVDQHNKKNKIEVPKGCSSKKKDDKKEKLNTWSFNYISKLIDDLADKVLLFPEEKLEENYVNSEYRWKNLNGKTHYECGKCGKHSTKNYTKCPNCGKKMKNGDIAWDKRG